MYQRAPQKCIPLKSLASVVEVTLYRMRRYYGKRVLRDVERRGYGLQQCNIQERRHRLEKRVKTVGDLAATQTGFYRLKDKRYTV